jgi:peptidase YpeB-like protein
VFGVVLLAAFLVSRSCGASERTVSEEQAIEIAREHSGFQADRVQVRYLRQGVESIPYWAVSLYDVNANGRPTRFEVVMVDARTGTVRE